MRMWPEDVDETKIRMPWCGEVRVLEDFGTFVLRGRELGRTTIIVEGAWRLQPGRTVTVELELAGNRVQVLTDVVAAIVVEGRALTMLKIGASSPLGNDLIAAHVRGARPTAA